VEKTTGIRRAKIKTETAKIKHNLKGNKNNIENKRSKK